MLLKKINDEEQKKLRSDLGPINIKLLGGTARLSKNQAVRKLHIGTASQISPWATSSLTTACNYLDV